MCRKRRGRAIEKSDEARERFDDAVFMEARLITKAHLSVIPLRWMRESVILGQVPDVPRFRFKALGCATDILCGSGNTLDNTILAVVLIRP
ncbi:hypothetical protein CEXT_18281 [Caerostris extrusa]|uniref:Uncharacterized protein n=1 Tax=Caerostris extrusa TaxID=172846 RepID=A0AAV4VZA5_CAEEX|nr:hypothetical protein CEXT_18281 [Caerostris extrusa]